MGQKVSPIGLRVGINKEWESKWFATKKDFAKYLLNDANIRKYLFTKFKTAGIASIIIERNSKRTEVFINASRPGLIIGQSGVEIENVKKELSKLVKENIQISVVEVKKPDLVAKLVADTIAHAIENRVSFRIAQKKAIRNTLKAGAKGIKTLVSGRLGGADMARSEGYCEGTIPLHTLRANIDYGTSEANTTYGKIGVKVWIYKGEILESKGGMTNVDAQEDKA